jgi:outer membrane protein assembly complex protein YaeT
MWYDNGVKFAGPYTPLWRTALCLHFAFCILHCGAAAAQTPPPVVTAVDVQQEDAAVTDPLILGLVQTRTGMPLAMADVRETITHLISLTRYEDVQVYEDPAAGGVRLRYVLFPVHAVDRIEFRGMLGVSEDVLRRAVVSRFGNAPVASRVEDVARSLQGVYRDRGYTQPAITPRIEISHRPDRASMVLEINAGPRAAIGQVDVDADDPADRGALANTGVAVGAPYDAAAIDTQLEKYQAALRARGYYEARATHNVDFVNGGASVHVAIDRGPHVLVAFAGDPLPEADRERLVPIRAEASADEDLLEDSSRAIEDYFHGRGYRDATAMYTRDESVAGEVTVRFTVARGPRYVVDALAIAGNMSIPTTELAPIVRLKAGDVFVQGALDAALAGIRGLYRARGFTRAVVMPAVAVLPAGERPAPAADRHVEVTIGVTEGPRTFVNAVDLRGNMVFSDAELRAPLATLPGKAYSELDVASDRDRIDLDYRNLGYETVVVDPRVMLAEGDTLANVLFSITEGPQVIVDHVIVVGNRRTSLSTIQRELTLRPGEPLGYAARIESQQRLSALGLFRRVSITELTHESESRRDVLVQVEEAPPTTISYGAGLEGQTILRPTGPNGQAEERFELAPRGSFEIARSNLWGKNRSVDLFTRASLKPRDILTESTAVAEPVTNSSQYGLNEYRVLGTYREPKLFDSPADLLVTAILDQAKRSSFNFRTREVRGEAGMHVSRYVSVAARYAFQHTKLFDEKFAPDDQVVPLIDRLFPQVRLSKFSNSLIRDGRDDLLDPSRGSFLALNSDVAARRIGSEVGFVKTFAQAFQYYRLPLRRRIILATAQRVGLAHGFPRTVQTTGEDGSVTSQTVQDLPASERFFAGGDTTVRGFSLDRLGTEKTISESGFPTGGNGEIVLNVELRIDAAKGLAGVTFLDAGNIFPTASNLDVTDLRPAAGFGVHYRSPVGPIRVELGFNLAPRALVPGVREKRTVLHISLGQAF